MYTLPYKLRGMDLKVLITHRMIHCKLKLYKTKVYLNHSPIQIKIENSCALVPEAESDLDSLVHTIFRTVHLIFLIFCITFYTHKRGKTARELSRQNRDF